HDAAAEDAIEFGYARREARVRLDRDIRVQARSARVAGERVAMRGRRRGFRRPLLDERVPGATVGAAAEPFRRLRAAFLADEDRLRWLHRASAKPGSAALTSPACRPP